MNIFVLDYDTVKAARYHCDVHVNKMILETAQMLSTAYRLTTDNVPDFLYRTTHKNHPCSIWARSCINNYNWLVMLGLELCLEYAHRFRKHHKTYQLIEFFLDTEPNIAKSNNVQQFGRWHVQPFPQAMPEEYKRHDAVEAYREYYTNEKKTDKNGKWMMKYTNTDYPPWFSRELIEQCEENK